MLGGSGHAPPDLLYLNGAIWRVQSVQKYVIITLKLNNFKDNFLQKIKIICHICHQYQSRLACKHESSGPALGPR